MSYVSRKGLEFVINQIGKARYAYSDLVGDLALKRGYFSDLEKTLIKFRGSTIFHDYDLSLKNNLGVNQLPYQSFDSTDNISLGFQGGKYKTQITRSGFANTGNWSPTVYNPPTPEGWEVLDYNAWSNYIPPYNAAGNANTSYIIYNINSEPGTGLARTSFSYPVRYTGTGYTQVNVFNSSRWVSVKNTSGSPNEAHLIIPKSYFEGSQNIDPFTNKPLDLAIYSHSHLLSSGAGSTYILSGNMAGLALTLLAFDCSEVNSSGTNTGRNKDHFLIKVRMPSVTWTSNYWLHLGFYWDTHDLTFRTSLPSYTSGTALTYNISTLDTAWKISNRKNYFNTAVTNEVQFNKTGVNDNNIYLFSKDKAAISLFDGDFISTTNSFRYLFPESLEASGAGKTNSLSGFKTLSKNQFVPVLIASKSYGNKYDEGYSIVEIFSGKSQSLDNLPINLNEFDAFPQVPNEYDILAKVLVSYPSLKNSNTNVNLSTSSNILNNGSIIYLEHIADNFALPPIGDAFAANYIMPEIIKFTNLTRNDSYDDILNLISSNLLAPFSNYLNTKQKTFTDLNFSYPKHSQLFHNLLKNPNTSLLKSNFQYFEGQGKISSTSGSKVALGINTNFNSSLTTDDYIYSFDGTKLIGQVSEVISDTYLLLVDNSKYSVNQESFKYKNSIEETEPYAISANILGSNSIAKWATLPSTTTFAKLDSNGLFRSDDKLDSDNEFEIYSEHSNVDTLSDQESTGEKISLDYSFKIKFSDTSLNSTYKTLFVNSSKYFITDNEYAYRITKNLSVNGFYKYGSDLEKANNSVGTLNSIEEYRLYQTASVIPDLKMGDSRIIQTKVVEPVDSSKTTQDSYVSNLKLNNPNITQTEIDESIANYELTNSFYAPDLNKFPNTFTGIDEIGVTVSEYRDNKNPHWIDNHLAIIGSAYDSKIYVPKHYKDLRSDSFIISIAGYSTSDSSINILENIYDQQISVGNVGLNQTTQLGYQSVNKPKFAIKLSPTSNQEIKGFRIRLQNLSLFNNSSAYIKCSLYSNFNGYPDTKLVGGSKVNYSQITNYFDDINFYLSYQMIANKTYWLVFESNANPPEFDEKTLGLVNVNDNNVEGIYNTENNTYSNFDLYLPNAQIGFGVTKYSSVNTWYNIASIGSSTSMTIASTGTTVNNQNYVIKYDLRLRVSQATIDTNTPYNLCYFENNIWTLLQGTSYIVFFTPEADIFGSLNRNYENSNLVMPAVNAQRSSESYIIDGFWSYNSKKIDTPSQLYIYPRSIKNQVVEVIANGTSGQNYVSVGATNYTNKILSGLAATQVGFIGSGTSVTSIEYIEDTEVYKIYLSSNLLASSASTSIYFGDDVHRLLPRTQDVHIYLKYKVNDTQRTSYIKLDKSPTWVTNWYKKNLTNYNELDTDVACDLTTATHNLIFDNFSGLGQSYYINGSSIGDFITKTSIGSTFDLRVTSSGGVKLYIDDNTNPYINQWKNTSLNSFTCSYTATGSSQPIKLQIDFSNYQSSPYLSAEFKVSGSGTWYPIDNNFYWERDLAPVLIDNDLIQNIDLVSIGKTFSDIDDQYYGYKVTDKFVFRNK